MKTIKQLEKLKADKLKEFDKLGMNGDKKARKKVYKSYKFFEKMIAYLESGKTMEDVIKQRDEKIREKGIILSRFSEWKSNLSKNEIAKIEGDLLSYYKRVNKISLIDDRIRVCEFLLSD